MHGTKRSLVSASSRSSTASLFRNLAYTDIVGAPPLPRTLPFFDWQNRLLAVRLANVPVTRSVEYYFSQTGDDSTGDGSFNNPYKTVAKANTMMATIHNARFRFKRGEVWRENGIALAITHHNTVDAYGSGARPIFTEFVTEFNDATSWTSDSGAHYFDTSATIAWVKLTGADGLSSPLQKVASVAACRATNFSFYHSGTRLHIRLEGDDINGTAFEACPGTSSTTTIQLTGDNVRLQGIRFEGCGMHDNAHPSTQTYSVQLAVSSATDEQVIEDCEVYYGGYHSIGCIGPGISTVKDCTVGLGRLGPGITMMVSFASSGGQETIFENSTIHSGALEEAGVADRGGSQCQSIFGHTTTGEASLIIVRGVTYIPGPLSPIIATGFTGLPTAATLADVRAFVIDEVFDESDDRTIIAAAAPPNMCQINCKYRCLTPDAGTAMTIGLGFAINCLWETAAPAGGYHSTFINASDGGHLMNCHFYARQFGAIIRASDDAANWDGLLMTNSIVVCDNYLAGYDQTVLNMDNNAGNLRYNAYYLVDPVVAGALTAPTGTGGVGAIGDAHKVTLASPVALLTVPSSLDNYYNAGDASTMPEYDFYRTPRGSRKTIGPVNGA